MSKSALTPLQRKAAERQRRAEAGLKRVELWALPAHHALIKAYAEQLAAQSAAQNSAS